MVEILKFGVAVGPGVGPGLAQSTALFSTWSTHVSGD